MKKPHTVRCVVSLASHSRGRHRLGPSAAMSGQTLLIKSDPREGVKKNLSKISAKKDVWPRAKKLGKGG
jgi:hypothetical protein